MAGVSDKATIRKRGFPAGISNTASELDAPVNDDGVEISLRVADNVVLNDNGGISRRDGFEQQVALARAHSGWDDPMLELSLVVAADTLYAVDEDYSMTALVSGLSPGMPLSYARLHDTVAWSNGVESGEILQDLTTRPWGCASPSAAPSVSVTTGAMDQGTYQTAVAFQDAWGRESGARPGPTIDVPANGGLQFENIPAAPAGGKTRIFVSDGHGGKLRAALLVGEGVTSAVLTQRPKGRRNDTLHLVLMPPGQCVAFGNGRQYVASGKYVLVGPALRYGLFDPRRSRLSFVKRVDMIAHVGEGTEAAGLFVADHKKTYFLAGADPANWSQRPVIAAGAMPGSLNWIPGDVWGLPLQTYVPTWLTRTGRVAVGLPGGEVVFQQPMEGKPTAVIDQADRAALGYREEAGRRQLIASLSGASPQALAVQDRMTVRYYPHED